MPANIFSNANKPVAHNGRNGFDLSSAHTFVMRCGITRPVIIQDTVPNSSFKINCGDIVRATGLQTAPFLRGKHELDFFFVPYRQLYSKFDDIVFGRSQPHSPALNLSTWTGNNKIPTVPLKRLYEYALYVYYWSVLASIIKKANNPQYYSSASDLFLQCVQEMMKFAIAPDHPESVPMNFEQETEDSIVSTICFEDVSIQSNPRWLYNCHFIGAGSIQLLSSLGYGDIYMRAQNILALCENNLSLVDEDNILQLAQRLGHEMNILITNISNIFGEDDLTAHVKYVSLMRLVAYQKVWYDVYRDSINDDSPLYAQSISCDMLQGIHSLLDQPFSMYFTAADPISIRHASEIPYYFFLRPRLRQYKKDLNTGLYPNTQFGDESKLDFSSITISNDATVQLNLSSKPAYIASFGRNGHLMNPDSASYDTWTINDSPSAYDIKYTMALQKYREALMRAGNRTRDLLMAEFGVKSRYIDDNYVHPIGSFGGSLDINKVNATADSGTYSVGDIAANVFTSLSGDTIDFTCNDYGVIIGVMSFLPEMFHNACGISPFNYKVAQFDFFHEAFENLGLQPVSDSVFDSLAVEHTHGFGARFNEYKQNLDLCHDTFQSAPSWVNFPNMIITGTTPTSLSNDGVNSNYVTTRQISQDLSDLADRNYIFPDAMDSLFKVQDDGTPDTSHFDVALQCNMTAVLPMSVLGMM